MRLIFGAIPAALMLLGQPVLSQDKMGLTDEAFDRLFKNKTALSVRAAPEPGDEIQTLQIFLTGEPNTVRGELVTNVRNKTKELTLMLEEGPVRFRDNGRDGDMKEGDGIFSAVFKMNTAQEFKALSGSLEASISALRAKAKPKTSGLGHAT